jgi:ATP-dependent helicase Lhr and Lhr-like helicase
MSNSPPSSSEGASGSFGLLDPRVQEWIWRRGWRELRDIQERAIRSVLEGSADLLIAAATASGKTEAVFFPLLTQVVHAPSPGIQAVYVGPLRALINDQDERLRDLCGQLDLPVHRWHGDVSAGLKKKMLADPRGILLITPESLEAMFVLRGPELRRIFAAVQAVVLDEVHTYIGEERGRQLQSLLHRMELVCRRRVRRLGLSATLGDMMLAADFIRPGQGAAVQQIVSAASGQVLRVQLKGYLVSEARLLQQHPEPAPEPTTVGPVEEDIGTERAIATHLFDRLYGTENLVFCNRRQEVELYADRLRRMCEDARRPNTFLPHHGSLSRELREDAERLLKDQSRHVTVVCTNTLELGIDIGSVRSVAQLGAPPSVAGLRQRLGRSGRRGEPAVLRVYVQERDVGSDARPQDQLRASLVQSVAMIELLLERWCEPPREGALHLSTMIQQLLSLIAQHGGVTAQQAHRVLVETGPFRGFPAGDFTQLLRALGIREVLMQAPDGNLLLGPQGERIVGHYTFFAAFTTPQEFRVIAAGRELGTVPVDPALAPGMLLIFGGRRWRVERIDERQRTVEVSPAGGGRPPRFGNSGGAVHDGVRERMRVLYHRSDVPAYLDAGAVSLLSEARENYRRLGLQSRHLVEHAGDTILFGWTGDRTQDTLRLLLAQRGLTVEADGLALTVSNATADQVADHLRDIAELPLPDPQAVAAKAPLRATEKHDWLLSEDLQSLNFASRFLDVPAAHSLAGRLASAESSLIG